MMIHNRIIKLLTLTSVLLFCIICRSHHLAPIDAWAQQVTSSCTKEMNWPLHGLIQKGDVMYLRINWSFQCECGLIGIPQDKFETSFLPDNTYGLNGVLCDPRIGLCEARLISRPSLASGKDTLRVPLFCPITSVYGMWVEAQAPSPRSF